MSQDEMNDGGTAFPLPYAVDALGSLTIAEPGMSLRDYFAAKALPVAWDVLKHAAQGGFDIEDPETNLPPTMAETAYRLADAMLKARAK